MLNNDYFDLWSDTYDEDVKLTERKNEYPFAGYKEVLNTVYNIVRSGKGKKILDVGFGTGVLSNKLYNDSYLIYGMDFSQKMIDIAEKKMHEAVLIKHDFTQGFPGSFRDEKFDFIICTYSIHHLKEESKISFIKELLEHLSSDGKIIIGDVVFETLKDMWSCRKKSGDKWDEEEFYCVIDSLKQVFSNIKFRKITFCSGVITIEK